MGGRAIMKIELLDGTVVNVTVSQGGEFVVYYCAVTGRWRVGRKGEGARE